jgi:hypothetical protein
MKTFSTSSLSPTVKIVPIYSQGKAKLSNLDLLSLLSAFRDWRTTDPRDKVYSLLGLLSAPESGKILPDYSLSFQKIYGQVVQSSIETLGALDALGYCSLRRDSESGLPSWVPDWRARDRPHEADMAMPLHAQSSQQGEAPYQASGASQHGLHFSEDFTTLCVEGLQIDTLKNVSNHDASHLDLPLDDDWPREIQRQPDNLRNADVSAAVSISLQPEDMAFLDERAQSIGSCESLTFQRKQFDKSLMALFPSKSSTDPMAAWDRIRRLIGVGTLRKLIISERYVGLGPEAAQAGDVVCILFGGRIPYLLRRSIVTHIF